MSPKSSVTSQGPLGHYTNWQLKCFKKQSCISLLGDYDSVLFNTERMTFTSEVHYSSVALWQGNIGELKPLFVSGMQKVFPVYTSSIVIQLSVYVSTVISEGKTRFS